MKQYFVLILSFTLFLFSCKKFLNEKPDASLTVPHSLQELRSLLDNYQLNTQFSVSGEVMSDNYFLTDDSWNSLRWQYERDYYIWKATDQNNLDWNNAYKNIYVCNLVLEVLGNITYPEEEVAEAGNIKATALFFRASYFFSLLQLYAKTYVPSTADKDPGIPLRLTTSFNETIQRNSIKECYEKVITDLKEAAMLLPNLTEIKSRPCKAACFGAMSRAFLQMQDFENALSYSDSCLKIYNRLIDYNELNQASATPFPRFNAEVIFQAVTVSANALAPRICKIDTVLYSSYSQDDIRKYVFFINQGNNTISFKGDYDGSVNNGNGHAFTGIATDEQYLIKAECLARLKKTDEANTVLNNLLQTRFVAGSYVDLQIDNAEELLDTILIERRKELLFRNTRLSDLKRLNLEEGRKTLIRRKLLGNVYELAPNADRYVSWIPQMAVERSGIPQNP